VTEAAMKLGEAIYKAEQEDGRWRSRAPMTSRAAVDDDIVDADFEDLDDDKRAS
jgi:molecular chaperone DnaK